MSKGILINRYQDHLTEKAKSTFRGSAEEEPIKFKRYLAKEGVSIILNHPFIYLRGFGSSLFYLLFKPIRSPIDVQLGFLEEGNTLTSWDEKYEDPLLKRFFQKTSKLTILLVFIQFFMLIILWPSFTYGMIISFIERRYLIFWVLILVIMYFSIVTAGLGIGQPRLRLPIMPFLAVGAGIGMAALYERLKRNFLIDGQR